MQIMIMFVGQCTISATARVLHLHRNTVSKWFKKLRKRYQHAVAIDNLNVNRFSAGGIYEADEMMIKGVRIAPGIKETVWVASIFERATGKCRLYRVQDRSINSLIPSILYYVPKKRVHCTVFTDDFVTYKRLGKSESHVYHFSVNHSKKEYSRIDFVPGIGWANVNINSCEGLHTQVRGKLRFFSRRKLETVDLILDEVVYRRSGESLFFPFKVEFYN